MFDFYKTLKNAEDAAEKKDYAMAAFHYWLIGFAYNDEEFPYSYTKEIGNKGAKGFLKYAKKYKNEILSAESYLCFKEQTCQFPNYQRYFENFERVINSFIKKPTENSKQIVDFDIY